MLALYRITRITTPGGYPVTDESALQRIGREGYITHLRAGCPMLMAYNGADEGRILQTSPVQEIRGIETRELQVTTKNSSYTLYRVEDTGAPLPIFDLE